jgi:hypothetical protein
LEALGIKSHANKSPNLKVEQKVVRSQWNLAKGKIQLNRNQNVVQDYEEGFNVIKQHTGFEDISKFVASFLEREDKIYNLMKNANERDDRLGKVEKELENVILEVERFRGKEESTQVQEESKHAQLQKQFEDTEQMEQYYLSEVERKKGVLRATQVPTNAIIEKLGVKVRDMSLEVSNATGSDVSAYLRCRRNKVSTQCSLLFFLYCRHCTSMKTSWYIWVPLTRT